MIKDESLEDVLNRGLYLVTDDKRDHVIVCNICGKKLYNHNASDAVFHLIKLHGNDILPDVAPYDNPKYGFFYLVRMSGEDQGEYIDSLIKR